jgi:hypothetical protein
MKHPMTFIIALCLSLYGLQAAGAERLQLGKTTILGNRELPKVTFVVPWADAAAKIPAWRPAPAAHPAAEPLDGTLYRRRMDYLRQQPPDKDKGGMP